MSVIFHSSPNSSLDTLQDISHNLKDLRTQIFVSVLGDVICAVRHLTALGTSLETRASFRMSYPAARMW